MRGCIRIKSKSCLSWTLVRRLAHSNLVNSWAVLARWAQDLLRRCHRGLKVVITRLNLSFSLFWPYDLFILIGWLFLFWVWRSWNFDHEGLPWEFGSTHLRKPDIWEFVLSLAEILPAFHAIRVTPRELVNSFCWTEDIALLSRLYYLAVIR